MGESTGAAESGSPPGLAQLEMSIRWPSGEPGRPPDSSAFKGKDQTRGSPGDLRAWKVTVSPDEMAEPAHTSVRRTLQGLSCGPLPQEEWRDMRRNQPKRQKEPPMNSTVCH